MKSAFHPEAREEFLAAVDLYNQVEPGLGLDFAGEINAAVELIEAFPNAPPENMFNKPTRPDEAVLARSEFASSLASIPGRTMKHPSLYTRMRIKV